MRSLEFSKFTQKPRRDAKILGVVLARPIHLARLCGAIAVAICAIAGRLEPVVNALIKKATQDHIQDLLHCVVLLISALAYKTSGAIYQMIP